MFLSIGMLKQKYFLTDIFILSAEKQPIKLSWRKIEWLLSFGYLFSPGNRITNILVIGHLQYPVHFSFLIPSFTNFTCSVPILISLVCLARHS